MLTLSRKPGESLHIGDDIQIVVKEIRGSNVRLGIVAPNDVSIYRGELYRKIHGAGQNAQGGKTEEDQG